MDFFSRIRNWSKCTANVFAALWTDRFFLFSTHNFNVLVHPHSTFIDILSDSWFHRLVHRKLDRCRLPLRWWRHMRRNSKSYQSVRSQSCQPCCTCYGFLKTVSIIKHFNKSNNFNSPVLVLPTPRTILFWITARLATRIDDVISTASLHHNIVTGV